MAAGVSALAGRDCQNPEVLWSASRAELMNSIFIERPGPKVQVKNLLRKTPEMNMHVHQHLHRYIHKYSYTKDRWEMMGLIESFQT